MASVDHRAGHLKLAHLCQENHDGEPVDKAQHHWMRHQSDELAPLHDARENLHEPHQHHGGKEVLDPMLRHQGHHNHSQRPCGTRDHARSAANQRCDQTDEEGRVKPHQRMHPGDKGKGHRFGHKCKCHGQPRQQFDPQPSDGKPIVGHPAQVGHIKVLGKVVQRGAHRGVL